MFNKISLAFLAALFITCFFPNAFAQVYEDFNYSPGTPIQGLNGGAGWNGNWIQFPIYNISGPGLSYPGLTTIGNVSLGTSAKRSIPMIQGAIGTSVRISCLVKSPGILNTSSTGQLWFLGNVGNNLGVDTFYVGYSNPTNAPSENNWRQTPGNFNPSTTGNSNIAVLPNTTTYLVIQIDFQTGGDRLRMWVNPPPLNNLATDPLSQSPSMDTTLAGHINAISGLGWKSNGGFLVDEIRVEKVQAPPAAKDYFGSSVAIYGRTAVVGIPQCDQSNNTNSGTGKVQIYERNGNNWNLVKTIYGNSPGDCFGQSVAIWANTLIVGANKADVGSNQDQGKAYIYERLLGGNNNYGLSKTLVVPASDAMAGDQFGISVDISGNYAIVGAHQAEPSGGKSNQGQAYIFERNHPTANTWGLKDSLQAFENSANLINVNDQFGQSVAIDANGTAVVGAVLHDEPLKQNQGAAYVFERQTSGSFNWQKLEKLYDTTANAKSDDYFGCSVAISGNTIIVGAFQADAPILNQGAAFIYTKSGNSWISQLPYKLTTSQPPNQGDNFGYSVDIWNNLVVVGAYYDEMPQSNSTLQNQGVTYFSSRNINGWTTPIAFSGNPTNGTDLFGSDVAIWDGYFIVGSPMSDIGTNQDQGSAYIFSPATGAQVKHIY